MRSSLLNTFLEIRWTISRGRDTYGYNICSLWVRGRKAASCNGGGYDMVGTVIADWMEATLSEELKTLDPEQFYGMRKQEDGSVYLQGACGKSSMENILMALGYYLEYVESGRGKHLGYIIREYHREVA